MFGVWISTVRLPETVKGSVYGVGDVCVAFFAFKHLGFKPSIPLSRIVFTLYLSACSGKFQYVFHRI